MRNDKFKVKSLFISLLVMFSMMFVGEKAEAAEYEILKVGNIAPITGAAASWGVSMVRGVDLAVAHINKEGGIKVADKNYKIEVIHYDSKGTGLGGAAGANDLVARGVKFALTWMSGPSVAAQPILEAHKVIAVSGGYADVLREKPFSFGGMQTDKAILQIFLPWLKKNRPEIKRVAVIAPKDETGKSCNKFVKDLSPIYGFTYVGVEFYTPRNTIEYTPILNKLLARNPDCINTGGAPPAEAALITKQARQLGFDKLIFNTSLTDEGTLNEIAGEHADGFMSANTPDPSAANATPKMKEFWKDFTHKWSKSEYTPVVLSAYDMVSALIQMPEKANTLDTEKIVKMVPNETFESITGPFKLGGAAIYEGWNHQFLLPMVMQEMRNGKYHFLIMVTAQE